MTNTNDSGLGDIEAQLDALRNEHDQFRQWVPGALLELDLASLRVTYMNEVARILLGYDAEDVQRGVSGAALVDGATGARFVAETSRLLQPGQAQGGRHERVQDQAVFEGTMVRKDGTAFPIEGQGSFKLGANGKATGLWVIFRDISERRALERGRQRDHELLHLATANTPIVLWASDMECRLTFLQGSALHRLGVPPGATLGSQVSDVFTHLPAIGHACSLGLGGSPATFAVNWNDATFEVHCAPVRAGDGTITGTIGVATDTTARRREEEAAFQGQKEESLGSLAGGMAHHFNNLLMSLLGNAHLLLESDELPPALVPLAREIEGAVRRASRLTANMLAYAGTDLLDLEPVDIGALLIHVLPGIRGACAPDVAVSGDIAPDLPPVAADTGRLAQALTNVVENAGDSLSGVLVPEIVVRAEARYLTRAALDATRLADNVREGTFVVISVEDNGEGVPADALPWIFDPFFSTRFTGRGLGLAAVHGIVRRHGGTIAVRSEQGQGTMISIMLPVLDDASARDGAG